MKDRSEHGTRRGIPDHLQGAAHQHAAYGLDTTIQIN